MFKQPLHALLRCLGLALALLNTTACTPEDSTANVTAYLAHQVMLPAYQHWQESLYRLTLSTQEHCSNQKSLAELQSPFLETLNAWNGLQSMSIGPLAKIDQSLQIEFWPDRKNLVAQQVDSLLQTQPNPSIKDIHSNSLLVRGLGAFEYLMFDSKNISTDKTHTIQRCALANALLAQQQQVATEILQQWQTPIQGIAAQLQTFPNPRYEQAQAAVGDLIQTQILSLKIAQLKLALPLEPSTEAIFQAEAWRTEGSLGALAAALIGLEQMWQGDGEQGLRRLVPKEQTALANRINLSYAQLGEALQALEAQPLSVWLNTEEGRAKLTALKELIEALLQLYQEQLSPALGGS